MASDRPIFVIGCARSGTTMLQLMIHSHERLAMPAETRFLLQLYNRRTKFGDLRETHNTERVAEFIIGRRKSRFRDLFMEADAARKQIHAAPATLGSAIGSVFAGFAEANGAERWGDKRPSYIHHMEKVMALFPDAQIIHIVRDGRDSISSLLGMDWQKGGINSALYRWKYAVNKGQELAKTLPADQYFEFRYEDLVANAEPQLRALCAFLNEDFDPQMLDYYKVSEVPEWKTWHPNTRKPPNTSAMQRWERDLSDAQIRLIETVAGSQLRAHGYELSRKPWQRVPHPRALGSYLSYERARDKNAAADREADQQLQYPHPVASAITERQQALARQQGWLDERLRGAQPAAGS